MRRSDRIRKKQKAHKVVPIKKQRQVEQVTKTKTSSGRGGWYEKHYKKLLIFPFLLLVLAIISIGVQVAQTGEFIHKGVSLKGGLLITVTTDSFTPNEVLSQLKPMFPKADIEVRSLEEAGRQIALTISADITPDNSSEVNKFFLAVEKITGASRDELSVETIGSSLGLTFFQQTLKSLFIAFLFMGFVVFLYFGAGTTVKITSGLATIVASILMYSDSMIANIISLIIAAGLIVTYTKKSIPSVAVILAAFSDMVITLAIINILGVKISTAGIAAFLMLIGYSVDTDILLSTRVLKRTSGSVYDGVISAVKTGLTMNITTLAAVVIALIFAESTIITQIMTILLIGLLVDMINTWFQNAGILRWHLENIEKGERS